MCTHSCRHEHTLLKQVRTSMTTYRAHPGNTVLLDFLFLHFLALAEHIAQRTQVRQPLQSERAYAKSQSGRHMQCCECC